jgi:hypothetical protein
MKYLLLFLLGIIFAIYGIVRIILRFIWDGKIKYTIGSPSNARPVELRDLFNVKEWIKGSFFVID